MAAKKTEPNLTKLYSQLQVAGQNGDYDKGLQLSDKILSLSPDDPDIVHFKVVCLVQVSRFQDALKLIEKLRKKVEAPPFLFEKAYCLYRLEKYGESRKLIEKMSETELKFRELLVQILYRQGKYSDACVLYRRLVEECSDEFSSDREANYTASISFSGCGSPASLPMTTMEQLFNVACCYLESGLSQEAEKVLKRAEEVCRNMLVEDDYSEEEIEEELAVIRVQLAYSCQKQANSKEALSLYNSILKQKPDDVSLTVIASNNIIVLNGDRDVFDSKKKIKVLVSDGTSKKLTRAQKLSILYNRCLFSLHTNQLELCRELVAALKASKAESSLAVLAEVSLMSREKKVSQCVQRLEDYLKVTPTCDIIMYLTLAQLYLQQGHISRVTSVLSSIPELMRHVGVVSMLASLYTNNGDVGKAIEILEVAVSYWRKLPKMESNIKTCRLLMIESAKFNLENGRADSAAKLLEQVHLEIPDDLQVTALLISAYSRYNPKLAEDISQSLPSSSFSLSVDVDALEQMASFRHTRRQTQRVETIEHKPDKAVNTAKPKKKKRKPRLPQKVDPNVPIDKERWIPLRERTYFRRGKRKGFIGSGRGSQGVTTASASLMAQLDASKPRNTETTGTGGALKGASSDPAVAGAPRAATQAQKKKPKKKKGKW